MGTDAKSGEFEITTDENFKLDAKEVRKFEKDWKKINGGNLAFGDFILHIENMI